MSLDRTAGAADVLGSATRGSSSNGPPAGATLTPGQLRELSRPDARHSIWAAALRWAVVLGSLWAVAHRPDPLVVASALLAIGWAQHGLAILGHDGAHRLLARGRGWNEFLGAWLCWGPLGVSLESYRRFHFAHHRLVGTDRDPELPALPRWPYGRRRGPRTPWIASASSLLGTAVPELALFAKSVPARSLREAAPALGTAGLGTVLCLSFGAWWIPALWFGASATTFFCFSRLRTFTEHIGADPTHRVRVPAWLAWATHPLHADHHWEHHRWPGVPARNLPRVRGLVDGPELTPLLDTLGAGGADRNH